MSLVDRGLIRDELKAKKTVKIIAPQVNTARRRVYRCFSIGDWKRFGCTGPWGMASKADRETRLVDTLGGRGGNCGVSVGAWETRLNAGPPFLWKKLIFGKG